MHAEIIGVAQLLLSLIVLVTAMAVVNLYSVHRSSLGGSWPLRRLGRGARLPESLPLPVAYTGFIVLASDTEESYAVAVIVANLAQHWKQDLVLAYSSNTVATAPNWLQDLPESIKKHTIRVPPGAKPEIRSGLDSAILFVEKKRIVEALAGNLDVAGVLRRFYVFAIPDTLLFHPEHTVSEYITSPMGV